MKKLKIMPPVISSAITRAEPPITTRIDGCEELAYGLPLAQRITHLKSFKHRPVRNPRKDEKKNELAHKKSLTGMPRESMTRQAIRAVMLSNIIYRVRTL
jgi:hypothetical protein